ncbi:MAG: acetate--CoA ligase family protein [archaeon]
MFYSEKEAENFLEKNGFSVVKRGCAEDEKELEKALKGFRFPVVMKVSGKTIVHKNMLGGVIGDVFTFRGALESFEKLKKIKGFEGVIIQEQLGVKEMNSSKLGQIKGKEVLIGVKKTKDFGHAICVGTGGVNTEKMKDVSFRIFPFDSREAEKMILETKISKNLGKEERKAVEENIMKVCNLIKKYPKIEELDINPLIVNGSRAVVVDARMVLE